MADEKIENEGTDTLQDGVSEANDVPEEGILAQELDEAHAKADAALESIAAEAAEEMEALEEEAPAEESAPAEEPAVAAPEQVAQEDEVETVEPEAKPAPARRERRSKQARAAKGETKPAPAPVQPKKIGGLAALGVGAWLGISAACLVAGLLLGRFALGGGSAAGGAKLDGLTTVSEQQLDDSFATYEYNGTEGVVTVREAIEQMGTLDSFKDEEGNYKLPSAEVALTVARGKILDAEAQAKGVDVSDDEVLAYAEKNLGTSDFDAIASAYSMDPEQVKTLITDNCRLNALREEVLGEQIPEMPAAPEAAEEGKEDEATADYADYIINLAGDEWNAEKGTWESADSSYATALADYEVTAEGASYNAAQAAYYVAYQNYTTKQTELSTKWGDYVNGIMSGASIQVSSLVS